MDKVINTNSRTSELQYILLTCACVKFAGSTHNDYIIPVFKTHLTCTVIQPAGVIMSVEIFVRLVEAENLK